MRKEINPAGLTLEFDAPVMFDDEGHDEFLMLLDKERRGVLTVGEKDTLKFLKLLRRDEDELLDFFLAEF